MHIRAHVTSEAGRHEVDVRTDQAAKVLAIAPKPSGGGSSVNGGELLFLALATCYCNDVYREAAARGIDVRAVEVTVEGEFGGIGEPGRNLRYHARVRAAGTTEEAVRGLLRHTDAVAEVHNTLRNGTPVHLGDLHVELVA